MEKMNAVSVTYEMISSIHVTAVPGEVGRLELELYWPSLPPSLSIVHSTVDPVGHCSEVCGVLGHMISKTF